MSDAEIIVILIPAGFAASNIITKSISANI